METKKCRKNAEIYYCKKCNFTCSKKSNYVKHLNTAKHKMETMETKKCRKNALLNACECGKKYSSRSGLWKHRKKCKFIKNKIETDENQIIETNNDEIIETNEENLDYKTMFLKSMTQNNELMNVISSQAEKSEKMMGVLKDVIPKIGNNNTITTTNNNNQFNLQVFLNEDCKDALNFSEFIDKIQVSFEDLENQSNVGYIKGISQLFIENLKELGTHKRPIHCTDKKRKTLYIKENDEWDKEGSRDTLKNGIQEVTKRTMQTLIKEKETNSEEYADMDSKFSEKCLSIQRNLMPDIPRNTTFEKVIENISKTSTIVDKNI